EARLGWNNERGRASDRIPGMNLWEVMGCREGAIETAPRGQASIRFSGGVIPGVQDGDLLPTRWFKETLEPLSPNARIVAHFEDGAPAAVMSTYGKGRTLMLGSYVSSAYQSNPTPEAARFFAGLLEWAGVTRPITVEGSAIEARHTESGDAAVLFLFNHTGEPAQSTVTLRRPAGEYVAEDLASGSTVPLTRAADGVRL